MPTIEGVIFTPLALYFFFKRPRLLFPLLILSTVFQASSIVSSGPVGIQPYYCIALLFVVRFLFLRGQHGEDRILSYTFAQLWIAFAIVAIVSATVLPFVFQGIPVFDPKLTTIENVLNPASLRFQLSNVVQPLFLVLNVLVVLVATRQAKSIDLAHRMCMRASYLVVALVFLQELFFWLGIPFPTKLLNNNPGYGVVPINAQNLRPAGSFTEPSMAGAVLAAIVAIFLWKYFAGKSSIPKAAIAVVACLLVASSSSLLAVIIVFAIMLLSYPIVRLPWFIRIAKLKRISVFIICAGVLALLLIIPSFRTMLLAQTLEKGGSDSAFVRLGADLFALNLTLQTHGLGVGLGSNRPSSFVASLLSQVGVVGFALFVSAASCTLWPLRKEHRWIGVAALGLLLSMAFGLPDLSFPFLWTLLALAAQSKAATAIDARQLRTLCESKLTASADPLVCISHTKI